MLRTSVGCRNRLLDLLCAAHNLGNNQEQNDLHCGLTDRKSDTSSTTLDSEDFDKPRPCDKLSVRLECDSSRFRKLG